MSTSINIRNLATQRALFVSKRRAAESVIERAKDFGVSTPTIARYGLVRPVYRRSELLGYQAGYPTDETGRLAYIMEN
jgi:hypothetical protein